MSGQGAFQVLKFIFDLTPVVRVIRWSFHFRDDWPVLREFSIEFQKVFLILGEVIFCIDSINRTFRFTQTAVNTFFRVDDEKVRPLMETVDGAHFDTIGKFAFDTRFGNDVSQRDLSWADTVNG
jgi:hypothetical protein